MSEPFVGEIRLVGFNFPPNGWALCNGQLLSIAQSTVLFDLIGTTYGGDGQSTFALPDLQGRIPIHQGAGFTIGQVAGEETVTLTLGQIPSHAHAARATSDSGAATSPANAVWAQTPQLAYHEPVLASDPSSVAMAADSVQLVGSSQPHDNLMPFLTLNFVISLFGVFPTQN
jgi:microcystin-dependent protein